MSDLLYFIISDKMEMLQFILKKCRYGYKIDTDIKNEPYLIHLINIHHDNKV